jgi:hypothetical protein
MSSTPDPDVDPRRVRIGLVFLTVVVLIALVIATFVDNGLARLVMAGIIVFTVAKAFVLSRAIRKGGGRL